MDSDGKNARPLTSTHHGGFPNWLPGGQRLTFGENQSIDRAVDGYFLESVNIESGKNERLRKMEPGWISHRGQAERRWGMRPAFRPARKFPHF